MAISAKEALELPKAQLTPEEFAAVDKIETDIDNGARDPQNGFDGVKIVARIPAASVNERVITALGRRYALAGWRVTLNAIAEKSTLDPNRQVLAFYDMILHVKNEAL